MRRRRARASSTATPGELRALGVASGEIDLVRGLQPGVRRRHARLLRPGRRAGAGAGHGDDRRPRGHPRPRAHPRAAGPALRPRAARRATSSTTAPRTAFRGLAEGDALRDRGRLHRGGAHRRASGPPTTRSTPRSWPSSEEATGDVPEFVSAIFGVALRPRAAVRHDARQPRRQRRRRRGLRRAARPPRSTCSTRPASSPTRSAEDVELGFDDDDEVLDEGAFGATSWYLFLAERIDPKVAFEAALGWDGDAFAAVERDGRTCVRVGLRRRRRGRRGRDGRRPRRAGSAAMPGGAAEVDRGRRPPGARGVRSRGRTLDLELTGRAETSLFLPNLWGYLVADAAVGARRRRGALLRPHASSTGLDLRARSPTPTGTAFSGDGVPATRLTAAFEACLLGVVGVGAPVAVGAQVDQRQAAAR